VGSLRLILRLFVRCAVFRYSQMTLNRTRKRLMDTNVNAALAEEIRRLEQVKEEEKQRAVREALGKFNFFIHLTGYISGCAYLLILGILIRPALPFMFIPIGLWTIGFAYHGYRAFHPRRDKPAEAIRADS